MKNKYIFVPVLLAVLAISSYIISVMGNHIEKPEEEMLVVTSFYPVYIAAINAADGVEDIQIECLTQPSTGCVHDVQLTTQDMRLLERADLFIINGAHMESYVDSIKERYPDLLIVDTSVGTTLLESEGGHTHEHDEHKDSEGVHEEDVHEEQTETDGENAHTDGHNLHEDCTINAHIWMDMENYCIQVENIGNALINIDKSNQKQYENNVEAYVQKVQKLIIEAQNLTGEEHMHVVSTHEAFSYFVKNLGWHIEKTINMDENTSLHAAEVSEMIEIVKTDAIPYVLTEDMYGTEISAVLSQETDSETIVLNTLVTGEMEKNAYLDGMQSNIEALKEVAGNEETR